jgi:hypothetical protein
VVDDYFKDKSMNQLNEMLFAFASSKAGPGRIRQPRRKTSRRRLDLKCVVRQRRAGRVGVSDERPSTNVSNMFKYNIAYRLVVQDDERREAMRAELAHARGSVLAKRE